MMRKISLSLIPLLFLFLSILPFLIVATSKPIFAKASCSISVSGNTLVVRAPGLPCNANQNNTYVSILSTKGKDVERQTVTASGAYCQNGVNIGVFTFKASLGNWPKDFYSVRIYRDRYNPQRATENLLTLCDTNYAGDSGGFQPQKCMDGLGIQTALGCIPVGTTTQFIAWFLRLAIGIGGGIAFLLMLFGVFQIITSAGDPERLKAGQELITSALIGLLMIIFSLFLLQLIGVQILQIPGFEKPPTTTE